ncbi:Fe-S biogenesis protein NfuA [Candidatus Palibaumannia cicadellinicola]|uniref:Fe/S biogenesis protein NfuA n=1 Tax=Candidatus Palibaumannia cicadellinicola TaxID=186490 RepID=A0A2N4XWU5_9GAMM|nr:NifU family protein [Candidatus Baumannia cicadellinicola]PLK58622.1 Fe-S biogenesis protein NfuA [Candidatus Baumannia cicadellinicola]
MISITNHAQKYLANLLKKKPTGTQIRIFVINAGNYNAECEMSYYLPNNLENNYLKLKFHEFYVYIDKYSVPFLKNAEIDLIMNELDTQLTFKAPYITLPQIDNNSSLEECIQHVLLCNINPQLANHGGKITLIEITKDMFAILEFSGGCNGCSMVNHTLKESIEKTLRQMFPILQGVRDMTEHNRGEHSYY